LIIYRAFCVLLEGRKEGRKEAGGTAGLVLAGGRGKVPYLPGLMGRNGQKQKAEARSDPEILCYEFSYFSTNIGTNPFSISPIQYDPTAYCTEGERGQGVCYRLTEFGSTGRLRLRC